MSQSSLDLSIVTGEPMESFFKERLQALHLSDSISIRTVNSSVGKGMFAEKAFGENEIIYNEMQMFGRKLHDQVFDSCQNCLRVIGDLEQQWECCESHKPRHDCHCDHGSDCSQDDDHHHEKFCDAHQGEIESESRVPCPDFDGICSKIDLPLHEVVIPEPISCRQGCGFIYCSNDCADQHWQSSHQLMCAANNCQMQEFVDFTNETNEVLYMVGQVISALIIQIERAGSTPEDLAEALVPLRMFIAKPWTEVVSVPPELDRHEADEFIRVLEFLIDECHQHLSAALPDYSSSELYASLFSREFISRLMGLFETNNIRMSSRSAIALFADKLEDLEEIPSELSEEQIQRLASYQDISVEGWFGRRTGPGSVSLIVLEGVGLYSLHSCMNHSCDPNCILLKLQGGADAKVALIALRKISKDEEITISYIDESADLKDRHAMLVDYGFKCQCTKCVLEGMTISDAA